MVGTAAVTVANASGSCDWDLLTQRLTKLPSDLGASNPVKLIGQWYLISQPRNIHADFANEAFWIHSTNSADNTTQQRRTYTYKGQNRGIQLYTQGNSILLASCGPRALLQAVYISEWPFYPCIAALFTHQETDNDQDYKDQTHIH